MGKVNTTAIFGAIFHLGSRVIPPILDAMEDESLSPKEVAIAVANDLDVKFGFVSQETIVLFGEAVASLVRDRQRSKEE
ncbi:hypothetical protein CMI47_09335 [Candidatus Pacearchaeota archaeon]|nr:hypothetical protein [Candidatus Pacearchaeota archaeon]|tara:strand:+ start:4111 stop:4347 length:237 start_codon:yes stop_codon:yes gene_type:complete